MTKHQVRVTIKNEGDKISVKNDRGMTWTITHREGKDVDMSTAACVGKAAADMLTGTIASQFFHIQQDELEFTLIVESK